MDPLGNNYAPFAYVLVAWSLVGWASATGCDVSGVIGEPPSESDELEAPQPPPQVMRRLRRAEYTAAVASALSPSIAPPPTEADVVHGGLTAVGAGSVTVSLRGVELYEIAAISIADQAFDDPTLVTRLVPCTADGPFESDCATAFAEHIARAFFARQPERAEVQALVELGGSYAQATGSFREGLKAILSTVLQSPSFLFRVEGGTQHLPGRVTAYDGPSMAVRLARLIWGSEPTPWLVEAASAGSLDIGAGDEYDAVVDAMLADPRARAGVRSFFDDMLRLDEALTLRKDGQAFPAALPSLGASAREATLRLIEYLVFDGSGDYREFLTSRETFVDALLAVVYRVPAPDGPGFARITLPASEPRRGLLGQASVLAIHSHAVNTSATLRGLFVRRTLLCDDIPEPPPDVVTAIPEVSPDARTLRERVAIHLSAAPCASCHSLMDPIGLSLENFDAIGQYRTEDHGARIDASGVWRGQYYRDAPELAQRLSNDSAFITCLPRTLFRYAIGRIETPDDADTLEQLEAMFVAQDYRVLGLFRAIATHRSFRVYGDAAREEVVP